MAVTLYRLPRVEGGGFLDQDETGAIRVLGTPPRGIEGELAGRLPLEAVYLTQRISADSGVSHALAAVLALEKAAGAQVAHNGLLVRDLMHTLSLIHAHLRHFYFQLLPDYLPAGEWEKYGGPVPEIRAVAQGMAAKPEGAWSRFKFSHPFTKEQAGRLTEHQARALGVLNVLQKMIAAVGGKFPVVMSIVPGGVSTRVNESLVLKLRAYLREISWFLLEGPLADGLVVVQGYPDLAGLGRGGAGWLSAGSLGDETGPDASLFPRGILLEKTLGSLQGEVVESLQRAFYAIRARKGRGGDFLEPAPGKPGAYSWIKAPRHGGRVMEVGPLGRLSITALSGSRSHTAAVVSLLETRLNLSLAEANTTAGRLVALLGEIAPMVRWCERILDELKPGEPAVAPAVDLAGLEGEGRGTLEAPAGAVLHRVVYEKGRVASYDVIAPSTWNGAPQHGAPPRGGLELALNRKPPDLRTAAGQRSASRILQSYFFSARDAVH